MNKNIALVVNGYSGEYVISVQSAAVIEQQLDKSKYNVYKIVIPRESWTYTAPDGSAVKWTGTILPLPLMAARSVFDAVFMVSTVPPEKMAACRVTSEMLGILYQPAAW